MRLILLQVIAVFLLLVILENHFAEAQCGKRCRRCSRPHRCISCKRNLKLTPLGNGRVICQRPKKSQIVCDPNCISTSGCTTSGTCNSQCKQGFGLTSSKRCGACDEHCETSQGCSSAGAGLCDGNCTAGYGLTPSNTCVACGSNCNSDGCNVNGGQFCDTGCVAGYRLTKSHTCELIENACLPAQRPLRLSTAFGVISSPNYPDNYNDNSDCQWLIAASSASKVVKLDFNHVYTETNYDIIKIYNGLDSTATKLADISGITTPSGTFTSTQQFMFVQFTSDGSGNYAGFLATFRSV